MILCKIFPLPGPVQDRVLSFNFPELESQTQSMFLQFMLTLMEIELPTDVLILQYLIQILLVKMETLLNLHININT